MQRENADLRLEVLRTLSVGIAGVRGERPMTVRNPEVSRLTLAKPAQG